jgi:hypothetical protein
MQLRSVERAAHFMKSLYPSRLSFGAALLVLLVAAPAFARGPGQKNQAAPAVKQNRPAQRQDVRPPQIGAAQPAQREPHLEQWMENHKNLSLPEMQRALQNEPGFRELPAQVQQNRLNALGRLYGMTPQQQRRTLDRTEALERLTPSQRDQWRGAVQQLNGTQQPRKGVIARAIVDLREMPPDQRQSVIDSPRFAGQFSPDERTMIRTLLTAEPYPATRATP